MSSVNFEFCFFVRGKRIDLILRVSKCCKIFKVPDRFGTLCVKGLNFIVSLEVEIFLLFS